MRKDFPVTQHVLDDLLARGLIAQSTDLDALRADLDRGSLVYYTGFDPTAPSLHIGHLMQLLMMRRLQLAGHQPLLLVGGATGLIGDPKQSGERQMNTKDVVSGWVDSIAAQAAPFLDFEGRNAARLVNNLDWTGELNVVDFLRDVGKHFPVNRMLARDVVASRLESGISYTEFSYVLLQSMDYLELARRYDCRLQMGGGDQWGNVSAGVELVRRADGDRVNGLVTPLITKADGTKFGKTEGGAVWLDPELTSPYAFYQFWINAEDAKVGEYLKLLTFLDVEEIDEVDAEHQERPGLRTAQRLLAREVTSLVHGRAEAEAAELASGALFGRGELAELPEPTLAAALTEAGAVEVPRGTSLVDALVSSGLVDSKSAARRAVVEGGAYVNNDRVADPEATVETDAALHGQWIVLRKGKRSVSGVRLV
ncbi:tyrosine--tRNA ligase [Aeromicrobium piscarium]|uniref:Tyrosine--tRNA ligase n=1 Tax=Aeromicrobium piscarium TaxID=2590901 RepID=A0A554S705_9ACTN|nr:tyrosine--tRNA ligase [Aeromicrobium piscarium]